MPLFDQHKSIAPEIDEALLRLAATIDEFEGYAHPHAARIATIAGHLGKSFGLAPQDNLSLQQAALIHDFGEMMMNRDYIKSGRFLTEDERFDLMRHPVIGEQEAARQNLSRAVQLIVRWHQEWWNGDGYPDGLRGEQIPLTARILRVADTYAALTDARPYKPAVKTADAKKYLTQWAGLEFDPRVVQAFLQLSDELPEMSGYGEDSQANPVVRRVYS